VRSRRSVCVCPTEIADATTSIARVIRIDPQRRECRT
jgi:hypothetical protein